jgi:3-oxoacyl-[acyl-carrier protein] reductase
VTASVSLDGRTVIVTGAGDGLGRAIAVVCGDSGAHVVVTSRSDNGRAVAAEIDARGGLALWTACDVTDRTAVANAVAVARERTGAVHAIVHNATSIRSSEPHRLEEVDAALWEEHAAVSLQGAYHCARAGFADLRATEGSLLVMTSPAGMEGSAMLPLYGTVKGALRGFVKSLAREWAPHGVRVNAVAPLAQSPAIEHAIEQDPPLAERLARRVPMGRIGDAEHDVAPAVVALLSDAARYVTGQTVPVNGGRFMTL